MHDEPEKWQDYKQVNTFHISTWASFNICILKPLMTIGF